MVLEVFGAACALIGGLGLFVAGEQDRKALRGVVKVEACEGRHCARCTRPVKICRFDAATQRWVYAAELECFERRCSPVLLPLPMLERFDAQPEDGERMPVAGRGKLVAF